MSVSFRVFISLSFLLLAPLACQKSYKLDPLSPNNPTITPTSTPVNTSTKTNTPLPTNTPTGSNTPTNTATFTSTRSPTNTQTFTITPTNSPTPTITPIPGAGSSWTQATAAAAFPGRYMHASVVYNNDLWVIGGWSGGSVFSDVWNSPDGINWTQTNASAPFGPRAAPTGLVFDDGSGSKMWLLGGTDLSSNFFGDVWKSTDGITWTQATASGFPVRTAHTSVVFNGKMWVIAGGYSYGVGGLARNDVFSSPDGVTWTQATANAAFSARSAHQSVVFNNKMWVIGGSNASGSTWYNDVWSSPDGINWTLATASAGFTVREGFACQVFNGRIWVFSGPNPDVWSSTDGVTWTQVLTPAPFGNRIYPTSAIFNNEIWLIAGANIYVPTYYNDTWHSP